MKFIYTPADGMNDTLVKYDISFKAGEPVEVTNLGKAAKMQKIPYFSACVEQEEDKPKRKRRTPAEMAEAKTLEEANAQE